MSDCMTKILVTGGAGFIGSNFVKYMVDKYSEYEIINLDALTYCGNLENLKEIENRDNYSFVKGDIRDKKTEQKTPTKRGTKMRLGIMNNPVGGVFISPKKTQSKQDIVALQEEEEVNHDIIQTET